MREWFEIFGPHGDVVEGDVWNVSASSQNEPPSELLQLDAQINRIIAHMRRRQNDDVVVALPNFGVGQLERPRAGCDFVGCPTTRNTIAETRAEAVAPRVTKTSPSTISGPGPK